MDSLETISGVGLSFHLLLAVLMIAAGIYTQKQWNCGCDVSRRTFVFLSLPCPVCLSALFIASTMLAAALDLSGTLIGIIVDSVFFLSALASSLSFRHLGKTPETLGSVMLPVAGVSEKDADMYRKMMDEATQHADVGKGLADYVEGYEMQDESTRSEDAGPMSFSGSDIMGAFIVLLIVGAIYVGFRKVEV